MTQFWAISATILFSLLWSSAESVSVTPIGVNNFAVEITTGLNVETLTNSEFDIIHDALLRNKIVVIRNQTNLTVEGQRRLTQRLGRLHVHLESSSHLPGYNDVNVVSNIKNDDGAYIGLAGAHVETFHSDLSWSALPTKITVLKSVIRPDDCGDTMYADTNAAYDGLSNELKMRLQGLRGKYCYLKLREVDPSSQNLDSDELRSAAKCAQHPLITTHPITGRKNIYANPSHTSEIIGLDAAESDALLQHLFDHTADEKYSYRHKYRDDDLILWDNRAVHHRAMGCPDTSPRKLVRTTVCNDEMPSDEPHAQALHGYDLLRDRVNAEYTDGDAVVVSDIHPEL